MNPFLLPVFVMTLAVSCRTAPPAGCIDESRINPNAICTMEYNPVCGCNGVTYGNVCAAENQGVTSYKRGACKNEEE